MKNTLRLFFLIILNITLILGCEVVPNNVIRPFSIQTHLNTGLNFILRTFALPDSSFVVVMENRSMGTSTLYKYSKDLVLVGSVTIDGINQSKPVFDDDGTFILLGEDRKGTESILATRLNKYMQILRTQSLKHFIPSSIVGFKYGQDITRLNNGNFVVCFTAEITSQFQDEIILFAVKDLFNDHESLWEVVNKKGEGEWAMEIEACPNGFLISGYDHITRTENFVIKYDEEGHREWKLPFPIEYTNFYLFPEKGHFIYNNSHTFYAIDYDGNIQKNVDGFHGDQWLPISNIVKKDGSYFYTGDYFNSDGNLLEIRKMDTDLKPVKSAIYGNRGTNVNAQEFRFLVKLANGEMVAIASVENPSLTGNYWLLLKFDDELMLQGQ